MNKTISGILRLVMEALIIVTLFKVDTYIGIAYSFTMFWASVFSYMAAKEDARKMTNLVSKMFGIKKKGPKYDPKNFN